MNIYHYHPDTKVYLGASEAELDPAELALGLVKPLLPAYSSVLEPSTPLDVWAGEGWVTPPEIPEPTPLPDPVQTPEQIANKVALKIDTLWSAANAVVSGSISGVALSLLTIGVLQSKPKALAVAGWSKSIWTEYYVRKALVTADSTDDLDFSSFGPMPHTVPELQEEIGL